MAPTDELNIRPDSLARGKLLRVAPDLLPDLQKGSTDDVHLLFPAASPPDRSLMLNMAAAVCSAFGYVLKAGDSPSIPAQQIEIVWTLQQREEERVADFFEPVKYEWNECLYRARLAARRYSDQTHADY
jgi:hypothetical protein